MSKDIHNSTARSEVTARILSRSHPSILSGSDELANEHPDRFYFEAEISSDVVDSYYTHMSARTLGNFARALNEGVSMLDSHDARKLGVAYSDGGRYEVDENGRQRVIGRFYTVRGLKLGGNYSYASTDDFIRAIETELIRDVSVGFYDGEWICDLCGLDYFFNWADPDAERCPHIAGMEYWVETEEGKGVRTVATVEIDDAELSEVSLVYDGATPGATILKARQVADSGGLDEEMAGVLERQFRVRLPATTPKKGDLPMSGKRNAQTETREIEEVEEVEATETEDVEEPEVIETEATTETVETEPVETPEVDAEDEAERQAVNVLTRVRRELADVGEEGMTTLQRVRHLQAEVDRLRAENARVSELARVGEMYRNDLIEEAIAAGVRAHGESFPVEQYRELFASAKAESIKAIRDGFEEVARERLPVGRQTVDRPSRKREVSDDIPAAAYAG